MRDYLLSREHPIGRFKARVFAAAAPNFTGSFSKFVLFFRGPTEPSPS